MIQFRRSIGFRLLGISFILLALPLLVDSFVLFQKRYQNAISDAESLLMEIAHLRQLPLKQLQPLDKPLLELLIYYLKLNTDFPQQPDEKLNSELKNLAKEGGFYGIFLAKITEDQKYIVVASDEADYIGRDYTDFFDFHSLYSPTAIERGYSIALSFNSITLEPYYVIASPIYSEEEKRYVGVLALSADISKRLSQILAQDKRQYTVDFALLLPSTIIFAATDPAMRFQYFFPLTPAFREKFAEKEPVASKMLAENPLPVNTHAGYPFFEFTWKEKQRIGYLTQMPNADYSLLVFTSKNEIFETPLIHFFNLYTLFGLILALGGATAYLFTMRMAKPIQNLGRVMQKIQEGDVAPRYQKDAFGFEINELGAIFNQMVDKILEQKSVAEEERVKREILGQELRLGQQVQHSLLPQKMPKYPGVDIAELYIPAIEVGGDFYDVFIKDEKTNPKLVLAVADASGKGVQACFYSLSVRNMLRTYAREYDDFAEAMIATNNLFGKDTGDTGMFITVLGGVYDASTRVLSYYSAGHNPGLVRRANHEIERLEYTGMAMGVVQVKEAKAHHIQLNIGDVVIFYTDGITEARNENFEFFTEERLIECLKEPTLQRASQIVERIVARVSEFVGSAVQHDDITLLVMKISE